MPAIDSDSGRMTPARHAMFRCAADGRALSRASVGIAQYRSAWREAIAVMIPLVLLAFVPAGAHAATITMFSPITVEATANETAVVSYPSPIVGGIVGAARVTCTPNAPLTPATYALGSTLITCTVFDSAGPSARASSTITVVDTTPPLLSMFAPITVEATSNESAVVNIPKVTASDTASTPIVNCPSGPVTFSLGTTVISCTATDGAGNVTTGTSSVTVRDTTPPVLVMFAPITVEATANESAVVNIPKVTATDTASTPVVTCPSGPATFFLGTTVITCTARDGGGNVTTGTSSVKVVDTTPPQLTMFNPITAEATSPSGAVVSIPAVVASDSASTPIVNCPSGPLRFQLGTTIIQCTATDGAGNVTRGTSSVKVIDTTPPTILCPATVSGPNPLQLGSPTVSDIADPAPIVTNDASPNLPLGQRMITWTATDHSGNQASCVQMVTVLPGGDADVPMPPWAAALMAVAIVTAGRYRITRNARRRGIGRS